MRIVVNGSSCFPGRASLLAAAILLASAVGFCRADEGGTATASYLAGLDALSAGRWADAVAAFAKAVDSDEDNADYRTARGVALVLSQQFPDAIKELQRSLRMRAGNWETKAWLSAAYKMGGDPATASQYLSFPPTGHGAVKADLDYGIFISTMAVHYWQAKTQGKYVDPRTRESLSVNDIAASEFPRAAAMFARGRQVSAPAPVAGALLERVQKNMLDKQYAAAMKDLDSLLAAAPEDGALLLLRADAALALGDYSGSRADYTRVLTGQPDCAAGYVGRARAAARLADGKRAAADLAIARKLGAKGVDAAQQDVDRSLAAARMPAPAEARASLEKAARDGLAGPKLVEMAQAVVQAVNARRLRYDEIYQDRLRSLEEARRADPKNPDRIADLADFLFAESSPPFEQVEPRNWPVYYRFVPQAVVKYGRSGEILPAPPAQRTAREVARAAALLDEALAAKGDHVRSLGIKGAILNVQGEHERARDVLDKALAIKPADPVLLRERSVALQAIARADMLAASALRGPKISTVNNQDGTSTTTTVYPSAADLARADMLEQQAKQCHAKAVEDMTRAQKLTAGTAIGAYYQGLVDYAYHNVKQAQADFQQAVKLDPKFRDAWEQLARMNWELGLLEEWAAAREGAVGSIHTTAGPWLVVARERIAKTQYKGAREALAAARQFDPADARADAYMAVVDAANDKPEAALAGFRVAMALEEARGLLHGRDLGKAGPLPVEPRDIGMTLTLRNRAAALMFQQAQADAAWQLFNANVTYLSSLAPEKLATFVPQAVLPGSADPGPRPATAAPGETYAGLKIRAQAGLDYTGWARRYRDAADVALASQTYNRLVVDFVVTDPNPEILQAVISLGLAELHASKGNFTEARELLRNAGATPQPLWQEMRKVQSQIR